MENLRKVYDLNTKYILGGNNNLYKFEIGIIIIIITMLLHCIIITINGSIFNYEWCNDK